MLHVCITAVSLLAVLAHVTLGCCLHHAHAAESPRPAQARSAGHHHHGESAHHDHDGTLPLPPHDDCHDAHCFMALAAKTSLPDHADVAIDLVNLASGEEVGSAAAVSATSEFLADASRPLSLRAHLRYCVLLN